MDRARVLMVDDHPDNLVALEAVLEPLGHELVSASSGEEALGRLLRDDFALILMDVQMPGLDGFETAAYVKRRERTRHIPIIFLTALSKDAEHVFRGYEAGAVDYIVKPLDPDVLRSKVEVFIELHQKTRALAESEERFRASFAHAPIGVALLTPEGRWLRVNRSLCRMLGRGEGELVGRPARELLETPDGTAEDARRRLLAGDGVIQIERELTRPDGVPVSVVVHGAAVRDGDGRALHVIVHVEDVTERRRGERERLERIEERARRAEAEAVAETIRKLQTVTDAALAHLALDDLCREMLAALVPLLEVDTAAILLLQPGGEDLVVTGIHNLDAALLGTPVPLGTGFAGQVAKRREPVRIDDLERSADIASPVLTDHGVRSLLGVPLVFEGRVTGVLHVGMMTPRRFTDQDASLLGLVADRAALAIEHARLFEREHGTVEALQRSLLPDRLPEAPGISLAARYVPGGQAAHVGGDWYDAIPLPGGRIGVVMGDVVGHGIDAAALMAQLRNAARAYAIEGGSPAEVLDRLDNLVHTLEPGRMATVLLLALEPDGETICLASAGHLPPLLIERDGGARFIEGGRSLPLGVMTDDPRADATITLPPDATLVLYTDGLVEERTRPIDAGMERLREAALAGPDDPEQLCEHLLTTMAAGRVWTDDVALLTVRTSPVPRDRLELSLTTDPNELGAMRQRFARWLADAGAVGAEGHEIQLACHEACSNAIEHGYRYAEARFRVAARVSDGAVEVEVTDAGMWRAERETTERGRGLPLIRALMDEVEVEPGAEGTVVRMRRRLGSGPPAGGGAAAVSAPRPGRRNGKG